MIHIACWLTFSRQKTDCAMSVNNLKKSKKLAVIKEILMTNRNTKLLQRRLFGTSNTVNKETGKLYVDVAGVAQKLILFDTYIMMSTRLSEIPQLMKCLGIMV